MADAQYSGRLLKIFSGSSFPITPAALAHVDNIKWLKDPDLFYHELSKEIYSNVSQSSGNTHQDLLNDRGTVINVLGAR
jgi:hypothetical protein